MSYTDNLNLTVYLNPDDIKVRDGLDRYRKDLGALEDLKKSISTLGQLQPILITDDNELIAGGRRTAACKDLGVRVRALYKKDVTDVLLREMELEENLQRKALTPAEEALAIAEIHGLRQKQHGLAVSGKKDSGWTLKQTASMTNQSPANVIEALNLASLISQFPSLTECKTKKEMKKTAEVMTKTLERLALTSVHEDLVEKSGLPITLVNADASEYMKSMPDGTVDILLTDPPFGIDIDKNAIGIGRKTGGESTSGFKFDDSKENALSLIIELAMESYRFCSDSAHGYVFVAPEHFNIISEMFKAVGWLPYIRPIVWVKRESGQNNAPHCWPSAAYEFILYVRKAESKLTLQGKPDWLQYDPVLPSLKIHPTEKPVFLLDELLGRASKIGQTLFDPFCGSGSSLESGLNMQLKVIGCEILPDAYSSAQQRLARWAEKERMRMK